ncbi:MAG: hypothetical protein D6808_04020 [Candidatus Dadabacteria bacterium]|nr:MAG: hypothetical protein D6808_04020 [Candidatus Dadabacteria bacterium]
MKYHHGCSKKAKTNQLPGNIGEDHAFKSQEEKLARVEHLAGLAIKRVREVYGPKSCRREIREIRNVLKQYKKVLRLREEGRSCSQIGNAVGLHRTTVQSWIRGSVPRRIAKWTVGVAGERPSRLRVIRSTRLDMAFVLGVFMGKGGKLPQAEDIDDTPLQTRLKGAIASLHDFPSIDANLFNELIREHGVLMGYLKDVASERGSSRNILKMPWHHLLTKEERRAFLEGFMGATHWRMCKSKVGIHFCRGRDEQTINFVALMLTEYEIYPVVTQKGLSIRDPGDLLRLKDSALFRYNGSFDLLVRYCQRWFGANPKLRATPAEYRDFMSAYELAVSKGEARQLSQFLRDYRRRHSNLNRFSEKYIRAWIGGDVPRSVKRLSEIFKAARMFLDEATREEIGECVYQKITFRRNCSLHQLEEIILNAIGYLPAPDSSLTTLREFFKRIAPNGLSSPRELLSLLSLGYIPRRQEIILEHFPSFSDDRDPDTKASHAKTKTDIEPAEYVRNWCKNNGATDLVGSYEGSLVLAVKEALREGKDPNEVLKRRVRRIRDRQARFSKQPLPPRGSYSVVKF